MFYMHEAESSLCSTSQLGMACLKPSSAVPSLIDGRTSLRVLEHHMVQDHKIARCAFDSRTSSLGSMLKQDYERHRNSYHTYNTHHPDCLATCRGVDMVDAHARGVSHISVVWETATRVQLSCHAGDQYLHCRTSVYEESEAAQCMCKLPS